MQKAKPARRALRKLNSRLGVARLVVLLAVLVIIMFIVVMIPTYREYQEKGMIVACATALDSARRQLAAGYMLDGFQNGSAEDAKELVTNAMLGWEDLCPDGGNVYIIEKEGSELAWDVVCGLHCSDKKLCTRLNADFALQELRESLRKEQLLDNLYPESLEFTLHHRTHTAYLVDEPTNFKRGTRLMKDYEGTVVFYSVVGHSQFGADSGLPDGSLWYFSFADEDHCATWDSKTRWTGDSYNNY